VENNSKFRVVGRAVKHSGEAGEQFYRSSYRILDHIGEEIDAGMGTVDFIDVTSAYNEAFALGRERLREITAETIQ
jgi:hypothetical protein